MSPTLLASRLRELQPGGLVLRQVVGGQAHHHLTDAGEELRPLVEALGSWGQQRWWWVLSRDGVEVCAGRSAFPGDAARA